MGRARTRFHEGLDELAAGLQVADIAALLDHLGLDSVVLLGHSLGGSNAYLLHEAGARPVSEVEDRKTEARQTDAATSNSYQPAPLAAIRHQTRGSFTVLSCAVG